MVELRYLAKAACDPHGADTVIVLRILKEVIVSRYRVVKWQL